MTNNVLKSLTYSRSDLLPRLCFLFFIWELYLRTNSYALLTVHFMFYFNIYVSTTFGQICFLFRIVEILSHRLYSIHLSNYNNNNNDNNNNMLITYVIVLQHYYY